MKLIEPDFGHPGHFITSIARAGPAFKKKKYFKGKIVLLVNERTKSAMEGTVMEIQTAGSVTTIGSQTAGSDGVASNVAIPGSAWIGFSETGVAYPDGSPSQRVGVKIDVVVKPTIEGFRQGKDEVLERAIELLK